MSHCRLKFDLEVGFDIKPHHTGKDLRKKPELRNKELNLLGQGQRAGEQEGKDQKVGPQKERQEAVSPRNVLFPVLWGSMHGAAHTEKSQDVAVCDIEQHQSEGRGQNLVFNVMRDKGEERVRNYLLQLFKRGFTWKGSCKGNVVLWSRFSPGKP